MNLPSFKVRLEPRPRPQHTGCKDEKGKSQERSHKTWEQKLEERGGRFRPRGAQAGSGISFQDSQTNPSSRERS